MKGVINSIQYNKLFAFFAITLMLAAVLLCTACNSPIGFGETIDFEPPVLKVTCIVLPDGEEIPIDEEDSKLFVGPGILVGTGFMLKGETYDNVLVEKILVEEIGKNAVISNGQYPNWDNAQISRKSGKGIQTWSIVLDGISKGERVLRITAYDAPKNIGPSNVKQLTLLVDTEPPVVENVTIERSPGLEVKPFPKAILEGLDPELFEYIDYFQNEKFMIRAAVSHDFSLAENGVTLNLVDEAGNELFNEGLQPVGGSLYTPVWEITESLLTTANSAYAAGRHYLNISITARAMAGHSGQYEDITNLLYNVCWYPESDTPRIQVETDEYGEIFIENGNIIPVKSFDDDNLGEIYAGLISAGEWEKISGTSDEQKLEWLITNRETYPGDGEEPLKDNLLKAAIRNTVTPVTVSKTRGEYRLAVLVRDYKGSSQGVWAQKVYTVHVMEEGIPVITVKEPAENTSPPLTDGSKFSITGSVINLDEVEFLKIAWIPYGNVRADGSRENFASANEEIAAGEEALRTGISTHGITIWDVPLSQAQDYIISGKKYQEQEFDITFDIFEDFIYEGNLENNVKSFMLYTMGGGADIESEVFHTLRLMPYKQAPEITVHEPTENWWEFEQDEDIDFVITALSPLGVPIESVTMYSHHATDLGDVALLWNGSAWTATKNYSDMDDYRFTITAVDILGNMQKDDFYIKVTTLPVFEKITSPHNAGTQFSGADTIRIYAVFDKAVTSVTGTPIIKLGGFAGGQLRDAEYEDGAGSTILEFRYKVEAGDITSTTLTATKLVFAGSKINASFSDEEITDGFVFEPGMVSELTAKGLHVDAVAPYITQIDITAEGNGDSRNQWYSAGDVLTFKVKTNKAIRVLGSPKLKVPLFNATRDAGFITTESSDTVMCFEYRVQDNDETKDEDAVRINPSSCFSASDLSYITDTIGSLGNKLTLSPPLATPAVTQTGTAKVDAVKPVTPAITKLSSPGECSFRIETDGIETHAGTEVEYTVNGVDWLDASVSTSEYTASSRTYANTDKNSYTISVRQIDRAGNVSDEYDPPYYVDLTGSCELAAIVCENPDGAYPFESKIQFKLIFTGPVYAEGGASIKVSGGTGGDTQNKVINIPNVIKASADFALNCEWDVEAGILMNPVTISDIVLTGVKREADDSSFTDDSDYSTKIDTVTGAFNRPNLKVMSVRPTITGGSTVSHAVITPAEVDSVSKSTITFTFSHPVWPENGFITVRPTATGNNGNDATTNGLWLIPPVLTSDEFFLINGAQTENDQKQLTLNTRANYYMRTTHGLISEGGNYVPDIETKYVLNFASGLETMTLQNGVDLRTAMETAKFMRQEIEVISASQVTGAGTSTITVHLDELPPGRQWKVEIDDRAFRDEAGNAFDGSAGSGWDTANSANWFWSQKTATPVIRVDRVSNNRAHSGVTDTAAILQTNFRYRIDCVTPGALIAYAELAKDSSTVAATTAAGVPYVANANDSAANSSNADATDSDIETTLSGLIPAPTAGTYTIGTYRNFMGWALTSLAGDNTLLKSDGTAGAIDARKDYIGAKATRTGLDGSASGYEGAFKTVVVYRGISGLITRGSGNWLKIEATNTRNGAVTIAGFPMWYNDMDGYGSKYAYRNGGANTDDWIFITWEIVSEFWQVSPLAINANPPGALFNNGTGDNSWEPFSANWQTHNYRKYGNWGMQIGDNVPAR